MIDQLARADRIPFRRRSSKTTKKEREREAPSHLLFFSLQLAHHLSIPYRSDRCRRSGMWRATAIMPVLILLSYLQNCCSFVVNT